ncbi:hypothetical protein O1L55_08145 [Streptomyces albulus]|nr:hypothetical protein [Streptomyces noursei]
MSPNGRRADCPTPSRPAVRRAPPRRRTVVPLDVPPDEETREHARILCRVSVRTWHFRGIGAHGVPTAAAEQGRRLDHGYPADPDGTLHLCRLDDHTRPV